MRHRSIGLSLAAGLALLVSACSDSPSGPGATGAGTGLRVINGAQSAIDVSANGQVLVSGLASSSVSQGLTLAPGRHQVLLRPAGAATGGQQVTVDVVAGRVALALATSNGGALAAGVLPDTAAIPAAGMTKLRVVHAAPNAPELAAWRTQPDHDQPVQVMFPFQYGGHSAYMQSTPGVWRVWVSALDAGGPTPELASSGDLALPAGSVRTVVVLDAPGGGVRVEALPAP